ncbi:MAG: ABC transporter permease [Parasporobacterium sp.]|nr:ABC transporter permease [Parasporobacterium sp.]
MTESLSFKNLTKRPGRALALALLCAFLCFAALAGSLFVTGLRQGLSSLETRLGADIMVVPYEATSKSRLSDMILQGNPGYFYMDSAVMDKLRSMEGVGEISAQFFLATASSSCCSAAVQIIGFDPATDFTIQPWVKHSYQGELGNMQVLVGNDLNAFPGDVLTFYGSDVTVAAKLDRTGTYLDTAVYANPETIRTLIAQAMEKKIYDFGDIDPYEVVSCVLINAADGYVTEDVLNEINIHVRKVEAVQTSALLSDVSSKLTGLSSLIGWLIAAIWILAIGILILAFVMISNERKKEFAVLRTLGASRGKLAGLIMKESLLVSCFGSLLGAALALLAVWLFGGAAENAMGLPFLLPKAGGLILLSAVSIAATILAGSLAAAVSAFRISGIDTAFILRGDDGRS